MKVHIVRAFVLVGALASLCAASGCVADRPSRNGVFNENQYLRKDFLIRPGDGSQPDPGWMMKTTVVATSTPNPLANMGLVVGSENGGAYVRFQVTQDKLNMLNVREISGDTLPVSGDPSNSTASITDQGTRAPEVLNAWPITNVDLKYRVNLDGEKTNFYEENQELDWQLRQWVKINFAKNDMSDVAPFGPFVNEFLAKCTDVSDGSATLVPDTFYVDEQNGYFQFTIRVTLPISWNAMATNTVDQTGTASSSVDTTCADAFGSQGLDFQRMGRQNVTMDLMYSFMRALPDDQITYKPLVIEEHDPIRRKYGTIDIMTPNIDPNTGLLGTQALALRFDPAKPNITYYFAQGYPAFYKQFFLGPSDGNGGYKGGGIVDQTNAILAKAGATTRLQVKDYDEDLAPGQPPRQIGDVRYSFIRWISDLESGGFPTLAVTQFVPDPRTGEILSDSINVYDWAWRDYVLARLDYYEQSIGAVNWGNPGPCQDGDTIPLVPATVASNHNGNSTLFQKMQQYLQRPVAQYGPLGPQDFIRQEDQDFFTAYYKILPFEVFSDPTTNPYVVPEGGTGTYAGSSNVQMQALAGEADFHNFMGNIDHGWTPYQVDTGPAGLQPALDFVNRLKQVQIEHRDYEYLSQFRYPLRKTDDVDMYSLVGLFQRDARHCINGQWETRDQYVDNLVMSYYAQTVWHEFGHAMGLDHNFMASIDRPNFPHYKDKAGRDHVGAYSSSLMEYNTTADRVFWANQDGQAGWFPYDRAAIAFIYSNPGVDYKSMSTVTSSVTNPNGKLGSSVSGQSGKAPDGSAVNQASARWSDPYGFSDPNTEIQFLFCNANHLKYSPFCRQHDFGTTPSEIIAADIDNYEWQYLWRNFRQYHKYFDFSAYANGPTTFFTELRRFMSAWAYDWSQGELSDTLRRLGLQPPPGSPSGQYFDQLTNKFEAEMSQANQLAAAVYEAIVQQSSGQRPFKTTFDNFYGDTTQQGIIVDKLVAISGFTSLWKTDNYDPNQAQGGYLASFGIGDQNYATVSEIATKSMIGGGYDIFAYATPAAVLAFAQATHDVNFPSYASRPEVRDWIGGYTFTRLQDFLDFFRNIAAQFNFVDETGQPCTAISRCSYDPRIKSVPGDPLAAQHSDQYNQFLGPDGRRWIWSYIQDRNAYVASDRDRNVATYVIQFNYNSDVYYGEEDGSGESGYAVYQLQLPLKYFYDYFQQYN
jgi:hypothetical protein